MTLNVLDTFAGIGGFSLGLERAGGFRTVAFCESNPWRRALLAERWPGVRIYDDVRTLTAERLRADGIADIDVVTGGFPCTDISVAGKGAGIDGEYSGLWRELARILGEVRPRYCLMENPAMLLARGLGVILGELAALGFDAEWDCVRACDIGAPHIRDRVWILAYPCRDLLRQQQQWLSGGWPNGICDQGQTVARNNGANRHVADADQRRRQGLGFEEHGSEQGTFWNLFDGCSTGGQRNGAHVADSEIVAERAGLCASESPAFGHRRLGDSGGARNLADASSARLSLPELGPVLTARRWSEGRAAAERGWWGVEPDMGGSIDGFPLWLDRHIARGMNATESQRATETLRDLWSPHVSQTFRRAIGGFDRIQQAAFLFAFLREYAAGTREARSFVAGEEASETFLRGLRQHAIAASAPHRREPGKQRGLEYPNAMQALSCDLALASETQWAGAGWEDALPRVGYGIPDRVHRLAALGDSLIPAIPEILGRCILMHEAGE